MMRVILALAAAAVILAACSSGGEKTPAAGSTPKPGATAVATPAATRAASGGDGGELSRYEDELREAYAASVKEVLQGSVAKAYGYTAASYKEKCSLDDFIGLMAFAKLFIGDLTGDEISVDVTDVRYEDDRAYVTGRITINGDELSGSEDSDDPGYWIREDGQWKMASGEAEPCEGGGDFGDTSKTPKATGPGTTRDEAVSIGTAVRNGDLEVRVLSVNRDAASVIANASDFPATPEAGRRFVLVRVSVRHSGEGEDTVDASESNFAITGSGKTLYEPFGSDNTSCGFGVPDELDATLFAGGVAEGNVCFQIPSSETGLILVVTPQFSFGGEDRRYIALE